MEYNNLIIPSELESTSRAENDVSILIGENGSGKSRILAALTGLYTRKFHKVIAISNSIHDKFPDKGRGLHLLRDRMGRRKAKRSVKKALLEIPKDELTRYRYASAALELVRYDPVIGLQNVRISVDKFNNALLINETPLNPEDREEIQSILYKISSYNDQDIIWLSFKDLSFSEIDRSGIIQLLKWEKLFKKLRLTSEMTIYLRKNGEPINLYHASSGELSFITSIFYIATVINEFTAILIDEPENSLHPKWQKDYVQILLELFYLYHPKIIIATHSALVLTGAEVFDRSSDVFYCQNFTLSKKLREPVNIEDAFMEYFNVVTPQNRYLSEFLVSQLNLLAG